MLFVSKKASMDHKFKTDIYLKDFYKVAIQKINILCRCNSWCPVLLKDVNEILDTHKVPERFRARVIALSELKYL